SDWVRTIRALLLLRMGRAAESVAVLEDLPDLAAAALGRATAYAALGDFKNAVADLTRLLEIEPDNADALAVRGVYLGCDGEFDGAAEDIERAIELAGASPEMNLHLVMVRLGGYQQRRTEAAEPTDGGVSEEAGEDADSAEESSDGASERVREWFSRFVYPRTPDTRGPDSTAPPLAP
ncbi:MAG: hypothetical protein JSU86_07515, partial [Phycisphaerales bacterium]